MSFDLIVSIGALKEIVFEVGNDSASKTRLEMTYNLIVVKEPFLKRM